LVLLEEIATLLRAQLLVEQKRKGRKRNEPGQDVSPDFERGRPPEGQVPESALRLDVEAIESKTKTLFFYQFPEPAIGPALPDHLSFLGLDLDGEEESRRFLEKPVAKPPGISAQLQVSQRRNHRGRRCARHGRGQMREGLLDAVL
jgi:hypothetical protein